MFHKIHKCLVPFQIAWRAPLRHYSCFYQQNTISMARTTGFTCTAVANLVLEKKYDKIGISPPEYLGDHFEYISNYLSQRNVNYKVKKII